MTKEFKRVIFTSPSGVKTSEVLQKFIKNSPPIVSGETSTPIILKVEDEIRQIFVAETKTEDSNSVWLNDIMNLPHPEFSAYWEKALLSILRKVELEPKNDYFLIFHACYFNHQTVEFVSCMKEYLIRKFNPEKIICFIDDIYDMHDRLKAPNQIFHHANGGAINNHGCLFELMRILEWRSKEIMLSRHLANSLYIPNHIFAIKHPVETLYNLIYFDRPTFYLSHPITEVRKKIREGKQKEADQVIDEVHRVENKMTKEFTCFFPTAIDELRIKNHKRQKYFLTLEERWDKDKYEHPSDFLFIPPENKNTLWTQNRTGNDELSLVLEVLSTEIENQVSSRDHKLVEQSKYLAVYRPIYNGVISNGVLKEMTYYADLNKFYKKEDINKSIKCFIYFPAKDFAELKIKQFILAVSNYLTPNFGDNFNLDEDLRKEIIEAGDETNKLVRVIGDFIQRYSIDLGEKTTRTGLASAPVQIARELKTSIAEVYVGIVQKYYQRYKNAATEMWEDDNLSPEQFVYKIVNHLKQ